MNKQIKINSSFRKYIYFKIIFYGSFTLILLTAFFLKKFKVDFSFTIPFLEMTIDKEFLGLMPILFSIWPPLMLLQYTGDQFRKILKFIFRVKELDAPSIANKSELNKFTYETIIPTIGSRLRNMNPIIFFVLIFILVLSFLILVDLCGKSSCGVYYVAIPLYGLPLIHYIRCALCISKQSIFVSNASITFPCFGFFKNYKLNILFQDIKDSILYGSNEHIQMLLDDSKQDELHNINNPDSDFVQGLCIWNSRGKFYILCNSVIPVEALIELQKISCKKMVQLI